MARFVYKMQNILDIKNKLETQARNSYARARNKLTEEEAKLDALFAKKKSYENSYKEAISGSISIHEINSLRNAIELSKNLIKRQLVEVKVAGKNVDAARLRLSEVMQDRKMHEKLKERAYDEFLDELSDQEKKEIDELVSFRFEHNE